MAKMPGVSRSHSGVAIKEYAVPNGLTGGVAVATDGTVWFTQQGFVGKRSNGGAIASTPVTLDYPNFSAGNFWPLITANPSGVYFGVEYDELAGFAVEENILQASPSISFTSGQAGGQVSASMNGITSLGSVTYFTGSWSEIGAPPATICTPCMYVASSTGSAYYARTVGETGTAMTSFKGKLYVAASETTGSAMTPNGARIYAFTADLSGSNVVKTLPAPATIADLAVGPDRSLWFTDPGNNAIGRLSRQGTISEFHLSTNAGVSRIVAGADGAMWFTETTAGKIGRITMGGAVKEFALPAPSSGPVGIASAASCLERTLWVAETQSGKLASISY